MHVSEQSPDTGRPAGPPLGSERGGHYLIAGGKWVGGGPRVRAGPAPLLCRPTSPHLGNEGRDSHTPGSKLSSVS